MFLDSPKEAVMQTAVISNDTEILVNLTQTGQDRIMQHYHDQGLTPLFVKEQGRWRLPYWLFLDLFEQPSTDQLFDGNRLILADTEGTRTGLTRFWAYHCSGCHQLVVAKQAGQPKFHIFSDLTASSDSRVILLKRHYLICPSSRCHTTTYLNLEVDTDPPPSVSSPPRRRPRRSRPVDQAGSPAQPRRRRPRSRTRT
jgi:hypothetical protein